MGWFTGLRLFALGSVFFHSFVVMCGQETLGCVSQTPMSLTSFHTGSVHGSTSGRLEEWRKGEVTVFLPFSLCWLGPKQWLSFFCFSNFFLAGLKLLPASTWGLYLWNPRVSFPSFDFPVLGGLNFPVVANLWVVIPCLVSKLIHYMFNELSLFHSFCFIYLERFLVPWLESD